MFGWFENSKASQAAVNDWYTAIMSKAREPEPFQQALVQDTLEGRFHMVTLVSTVVMRRLRDFDVEGRALADGVYKRVFSSFDHALREEGVGDSSIARKMRKMGEAFFGLARALDAGFEADDQKTDVRDALVRNVQPDPAKAEALTMWLLGLEGQLRALPEVAALKGKAPWSDA